MPKQNNKGEGKGKGKKGEAASGEKGDDFDDMLASFGSQISSQQLSSAVAAAVAATRNPPLPFQEEA